MEFYFWNVKINHTCYIIIIIYVTQSWYFNGICLIDRSTVCYVKKKNAAMEIRTGAVKYCMYEKEICKAIINGRELCKNAHFSIKGL